MRKKSNPMEKTVLQNLSEDCYRTVFQDAVHFTFKTVNSNARAGGIRLSPQEGKPLPYVTARSLLNLGLPLALDYTKNYGQIATAFKHLRLTSFGSEVEVISDPDQVLSIAEEISDEHYEVGTDRIDARLRQILLPKEKSHQHYVAVTPLVAGGLAKHLSQAVAEVNQKITPEQRHIRTAYLGIGGSKPMNVSALSRYFQTPLFFDAPREAQALRSAYRFHYQGLKLSIPGNLMKDYFDWRRAQLKKGGGRMPSRHRTRLTESEWVRQIIAFVLRRARQATETLLDVQEHLPDGALVDSALALSQRGLLDPKQRCPRWRAEMAVCLSEAISEYRLQDDAALGFNESGKKGIAALIEELLP